jgi:outer membrane lipoprotein-sorting protein
LFRAAVYLVLSGVPVTLSYAQEVVEPEAITLHAIIDSLVRQFERVQDYSVTVRISVEMPYFRMPNKKVKLYFKQPDKIKLEADGFAVVPRTGLTLSPREIFDKLSTAQVTGRDTIDGHSCWLLEGRIHPDSLKFRLWDDTSPEKGLPRMRLWVDPQGWVISRMETVVDTLTLMMIQSTYRQFDGDIWLPRKTEMRFSLPGEHLQRIGDHEPFAGPFGDDQIPTDTLKQGSIGGTVTLKYSRYRINKGLKDRFFRDSDL